VPEPTVPEPPIQVPDIEKHPRDKLTPLAKVEVAPVEVMFKTVACRPAAKVDVAIVEVETTRLTSK
jgi:hypothetical protein